MRNICEMENLDLKNRQCCTSKEDCYGCMNYYMCRNKNNINLYMDNYYKPNRKIVDKFKVKDIDEVRKDCCVCGLSKICISVSLTLLSVILFKCLF